MVAYLLLSNLHLQHLNLIKPADQVIFEVVLDLGGDRVNVVVGPVYLAKVKLILDKVDQLLIKNAAVLDVTGTLPFWVRSVKLGLEFVLYLLWLHGCVNLRHGVFATAGCLCLQLFVIG